MTRVLRPVRTMSTAAVLTLFAGVIPAHGQTRFDDVRLVVDADEESADLERAILTSDPQGRRLRIERLPGDAVAAVLDTLERDTGLAVDRRHHSSVFRCT